jgi:hypothetical protein
MMGVEEPRNMAGPIILKDSLDPMCEMKGIQQNISPGVARRLTVKNTRRGKGLKTQNLREHMNGVGVSFTLG